MKTEHKPVSMKMLQGLELLCSGDRLGEPGVITWRKEGSEEILEHLECLNGLKRDGEGIYIKGMG